ncbi:hypothetical protein [Clostridium sp. DL1XJH146]
MSVAMLLVLAFLGESVWETLKMVWQEGKISFDRIGAIIVGIIIAIGTGADLFAVVGVPFKIPIIGIVLTGLLISRGANFLHDLIGSLSNLYGDTKISKSISETKDEVMATTDKK